MVLKKQKNPNSHSTARPPYPVFDDDPPTGNTQGNFDEPYSPSLLQSPAFDLRDLSQAQGMSLEQPASTVAPVPESLRVGKGRVEHQSRLSSEVQKSLDKGDIPDVLRPGAKVQVEKVRRSSESERKDETFMHGARSREEDGDELVTTPAAVARERGSREEKSEAFEGGEVVKEQIRQFDSSSPAPQMSASSHSADGPFTEFRPFYSPLDSSFSDASQNPPIPSQQPPKQPPIITTTSPRPEITQRQHSVAESTVSSIFEPGADLSSFDASIVRAYSGQRGEPSVGMSGWSESIAEEPVPKTWEEELDQRAKAGAELQRRTEQAARREKEKRLQAEFWEEERKEQERVLASRAEIPGPPIPPKSPPGEASKPEQAIPIPDSSPISPPTVPAPAPAPRISPVQPSVTTTTAIYQIKHVNWVDPSQPGSALRRSPILLQNANGPCPLLALVNALILSTPVSVKTSLTEVLRLREQVSLELLLDAVFEELMARGSGGLPDVGDLFAFLLTLHTGMNVNPRFLPLDGEPRASTSGGFEDTREMALYGAFEVPLVHGWLPEPTDPVLDAMRRHGAGSYEEAQTLLLAEEEIITRITSGTQLELSSEEERICDDARIIRDFMERSKTQLTSHGLEVVRKGLRAGHVAILFRNDHFMTILGGGRAGGDLMGLVTDQGFASHEEVVFERLADVQGRQNEFLSGDFRPVGGGNSNANNGGNSSGRRSVPRQEVRSLVDDSGWETVGSRRTRDNSQSLATTIERAPPSLPPRPSSSSNQQAYDCDADLALAMQLQEEEDERHRRHQSRARNSAPAVPVASGNPAPPPAIPQRMSTPVPAPRIPPLPFETHRPGSRSEEAPPPYERVPRTPTTALTLQSSSHQQQSPRAAPPGPPFAGANPAAVARRGEARDMLQEINGRSGGGPLPTRRSSVGAVGEASGGKGCTIC